MNTKFILISSILCSGLMACGGGGSESTGGKPLADFFNRDGGDNTFMPTNPAPSGCVADASEPNDSVAQARAINNGDSLSLNFCDDAIDVFRISVNPGTRIIAETSALGPRADTVINLRNPAGELLESNDDFGGTLASRVDFTTPSGLSSLLIEVVPFNTSEVGEGTAYALSVSLGSTTVGLPDFDFDISLVSRPADDRSFEFEIPVRNIGAVAESADVGLYLSDDTVMDASTDRLLDFFTTDVIPPSGQVVLRGVISFPADVNGEFTFGLIVDDLDAVAESNEDNNTARFPRLSLRSPEQTCFDDFFSQSNSTPADALELSLPADFEGRHCTDAQDWFEFAATVGANYSLSTTRLDDRADTVLEVYTLGGTLIASNDDVARRDSALQFVAPTTGTVRVLVRSFGDNFGRERSYALHIRENDNRADLIAALELPAGPFTAGSTVESTLTVVNLGNSLAPASDVTITAFEQAPRGRLGSDDARNFTAGSASVTELAAGARASGTITLSIPDVNADFAFSPNADSGSAVAEAVEFDAEQGLFFNQGNFVRRTVTGASGQKFHLAGGPAEPGSLPLARLPGVSASESQDTRR